MQFGCKPLGRCEGRDCIGLTRPDLENGDAFRLQQPGKLGQQRAIIVEPLLACEQGRSRLVIAHIRVEIGVVLDIGRIAQDEIEGSEIGGPARLVPIALLETGPRSKAEPLGILARDGQRSGGAIRSDTLGGGFGKNAQEQRARPRAEVEDPRG